MLELESVKKSLGITGNYQDETIKEYIKEVKRYLIDGGIDRSIVESQSTVGIIARGVADLWNYGSGGTSFSPYFIQRVIQLSSKDSSKSEGRNSNEWL